MPAVDTVSPIRLSVAPFFTDTEPLPSDIPANFKVPPVTSTLVAFSSEFRISVVPELTNLPVPSRVLIRLSLPVRVVAPFASRVVMKFSLPEIRLLPLSSIVPIMLLSPVIFTPPDVFRFVMMFEFPEMIELPLPT